MSISRDTVAVLGTAMTDMSRRDLHPDQMALQAVAEAIADAGVQANDLALVVVGNAGGARLNDQGSIRGQAWLRKASLGDVPIINVDNSCAGGAAALHLGVLTALGQDRPILVLGVEKMWTGDRAATLEAIEAGLPSDYRADMHARLAGGGNPAGSILMGLNAAWAEQFMTERDATLEQIAAVAVKARRNGSMNPLAQCQQAVTMDEVLESPQVAGVLTRLMCSSFTDGAAAVIVAASSTSFARPLARIVGSVARSGCGNIDYHDRLAETANAAYETFGLGPGDFDLVELHDATSAEELFALESLGLFEPGPAGPATWAGDTAIGGGAITVNPSGGLVARGHPLGATGLAQVVEIVNHLAGRAGARQIDRARLGLAVNTGGVVNGDAGYVGMTALAGADAR
ncbi:MAG: thiolase family protein [Acidimicrobiales bacterium]